MLIKAISLDVGGTLIEPWPSVGAVYARVAREMGRENYAPELLNRQFVQAWKSRANFGYSRAEWKGLVCDSFANCTEVDDRLFEAIYAEFSEARSWSVFPDVHPELERIKKRGLKVAAVSNWDDRLKPLLKSLDLTRYFDCVIVSKEIGCHKPGPAIFEAAARALKVPLSCILHIGDSQHEDVEGARLAGLQSSLVVRSGPSRDHALAALLQSIPYSEPLQAG